MERDRLFREERAQFSNPVQNARRRYLIFVMSRHQSLERTFALLRKISVLDSSSPPQMWWQYAHLLEPLRPFAQRTTVLVSKFEQVVRQDLVFGFFKRDMLLPTHDWIESTPLVAP